MLIKHFSQILGEEILCCNIQDFESLKTAQYKLVLRRSGQIDTSDEHDYNT